MLDDKLDDSERRVVWTNVLINMTHGETVNFITPQGDVEVTYNRPDPKNAGWWSFGFTTTYDVDYVLSYLMARKYGLKYAFADV